MVGQLEPADQPITLARAAELAGLTTGTMRVIAANGKIEVLRYGHERLTTRRMLHRYLMSRDNSRGAKAAPLPPDYVAPE
jgi:hypothetical protein